MNRKGISKNTLHPRREASPPPSLSKDFSLELHGQGQTTNATNDEAPELLNKSLSEAADLSENLSKTKSNGNAPEKSICMTDRGALVSHTSNDQKEDSAFSRSATWPVFSYPSDRKPKQKRDTDTRASSYRVSAEWHSMVFAKSICADLDMYEDSDSDDETAEFEN